MTLFEHAEHPHIPTNPNEIHKAEQSNASLNERIAVTLTRYVSTMQCAYFFVVIALVGLFGLLGWLNPFVFLLMTWLSQQFLQLVFLPILSVGQGVLSRQQAIQADETHNVALKNAHDIAQIAEHLATQDKELIEQTKILQEIKDKQ
jgi:nitrate reductase NapE component